MTTIQYQYLGKLRQYLEDEFIANPPPVAIQGGVLINGKFSVGRLQADPTRNTFVVTLHEGNPTQISKSGKQPWPHEVDQQGAVINTGSGCLYPWFYRYTASSQFYMVRTGEAHSIALERGSVLEEWLRQKIAAAQPGTLGMTADEFGAYAYRCRIVRMEPIEGGGPPTKYISKNTHFIEQDVYAA